KLALLTGIINITDVPYDVKAWYALCEPLKDEPERGRRCAECFKIRLERTAQKALELGIESFATTLTISPHKDAKLINTLGNVAAKKYGVKYYETDFKKKDGFKKSIELSKKHGLYRQDYCGCVYSRRKNG
ncbi:MAG TPA: epoxyqueuosine reductase QueH, partial [Candidatus Goldiibacteriota bacterium]|nr:epoxyqueuosine reductase QueH [Candidatus Goldiibacteriota bacterium]